MKEDIESKFGDELSWESSPDRIQCRICFKKDVDGYDRQEWPKYTEWLVEHMTKLEIALREPLQAVNQLLKGDRRQEESNETK